MNTKELIQELLQDPEFAKEYYKEDIGHDIAMQIFEARLKTGMTQKQLAEKIGTKQSSIARIEDGENLPSLRFLKKIADAFGTKLIAPRFEFLGEPRPKIKLDKKSRPKMVNIKVPKELQHEIMYVVEKMEMN